MIYGYIRGSTDKQDCENQKLGIESKASALGLKIDKYIEDAGISGIKSPKERALGGMLRKLQNGDIAGSIYEFANIRSKNFPFMTDRCYITADSCMSIAQYSPVLANNVAS